MSQNKRNFQSKGRPGGQKSGGGAKAAAGRAGGYKGSKSGKSGRGGKGAAPGFGKGFKGDKVRDGGGAYAGRPGARQETGRAGYGPKKGYGGRGGRDYGGGEDRDDFRPSSGRARAGHGPQKGRDRNGARPGDRPQGRDGKRGGFGGGSQGRDRGKGYQGRAQKRGPDHAAPPAAREAPAQASLETREKLKSGRAGYGPPSPAFLFGVHAVRAAVQNPRRAHQRLLCTADGFEAIADACEAALQAGIRVPDVTYVEKEDLSRLLPRDAVHQGVLLDSQPPEEVFLSDILIAAGDDARIVVLDQVTDPHNVGAILRSACAFGAAAVVMQKLHAPDVTGTLAKAASGAAEHVPIVREVNLARALQAMKDAGFTCYGLDERGEKTIAQATPSGRVALVLGAEGPGLRRLVRETCDHLVRLPATGKVGSLNVSNAAAVALYEVAR